MYLASILFVLLLRTFEEEGIPYEGTFEGNFLRRDISRSLRSFMVIAVLLRGLPFNV